jgi:plastocyanin
MTKLLLLFAAAVAGAPALALAADTGAIPAKTAAIEIRNMHYNPANLTIAAGTTVTWVNKDESPHTVTDKGLAFRSAALDTDERFSHTFMSPGEFTYFCTIHPMMVGRIIVRPLGKSS